MTQQEIKAYSEKLLSEIDVVTILDYVKKLNDKFYHMDISFIDDFIDLVSNDGFVIPHEMLFKYEILTKTESSNDVLRILERYNFEDTVDYLRKVTRVDDGRTEKNMYMLTSDVFKMLCMRSKSTKRYSQYYL